VTVVALGQATARDGATALSAISSRVMTVPISGAAALARCGRALVSPRPLQVAYCAEPQLEVAVRDIVADADFDVAHIEHIRAAPLVRVLGHLPSVYDAVDCMTLLLRRLARHTRLGLRRMVLREELRRLWPFEPEACLQFDRVVTTSELDRRALRSLCRGFIARQDGRLAPASAARAGLRERIVAIPNGVDCEYFRPAASPTPAPQILFWGRLGYAANADAVRHFAHKVLPIVRREVASARFVVVGADPGRSVRAMAGRGEIELHASVPDIRPFLREAAVAVAPMRVAVGVQNKVLEAMASGVPVVCTPGARQGIDAQDGEHVLVGPDAQTLAQHVVRLLLDREFSARIAGSAREQVERAHSWEVAAARLEAVYAEAVQAHYARSHTC
jgi:glycosyltransferase involved in cell wall biosynthesis